MKVKKDKHIKIQLTSLISFVITFSVFFVYFLGWNFEIISFLIAIGILICLISITWLICLILIKCEKRYYLIENDRITLWRKDALLCELKSKDMINIDYVRFFWTLLLQMGAGYMCITCPMAVLPDKKFAELGMPDGTAIFAISMSKKQAKAVAKILNRNVTIK